MRAILVPVADRPECANALQSTFDLAKRLDANVTGCHVRPHRDEQTRGGAKVPTVLRHSSDWQKGLTEDQVRMDSKAAHDFFMALIERHDFEFTKHARYREGGGLAMWQEMTGSPEKVLAIAGPVSDLLVVSRPRRKASARARSFLLAALMHSGRPVLMLPNKRLRGVGTRVLIAWNQSPEAALAVRAAMGLLLTAEQVTILAAGSENRVGPKSTHLQHYLRQWGVKAERLRTRGAKVEQELEKSYEKTDSNLLIMGAYSRGRWRETVFGGLTEHVLNRTSLPALMLHHG